MNIDEALYQLKQRIKMHELECTTSNENEREKALLNCITNLQERNKKAIEYINKNKHIDDYGIWIIEDDNDYLLNILEGSNKDE